jgi:hypothetical protein
MMTTAMLPTDDWFTDLMGFIRGGSDDTPIFMAVKKDYNEAKRTQQSRVSATENSRLRTQQFLISPNKSSEKSETLFNRFMRATKRIIDRINGY